MIKGTLEEYEIDTETRVAQQEWTIFKLETIIIIIIIITMKKGILEEYEMDTETRVAQHEWTIF